MLELTQFEPRMIHEVVTLFKNTILTVNRKDYSEEQVEAWANSKQTIDEWVDRLQQSVTYVATFNKQIVGFGNITKEGLIDLLYVHKDYQAEGIGSRILEQLESDAKLNHIHQLTTEASITAKLFFLVQGFKVQEVQTKIVAGVNFINYRMNKTI